MFSLRTALWLFLYSAMLILAACSPSEEESARARSSLAKVEDILAECRMFAQQSGIRNTIEDCAIFLDISENCSIFPEQKEGCVQFIRDPGYMSRKQECENILQQEKNCEAQVDEYTIGWYVPFLKKLGVNWEQKEWYKRVEQIATEIHIGGLLKDRPQDEEVKHGVEFAVDEINQQGGVLDRKLVLHWEKVKDELKKARKIANHFRDDYRIRAVIGFQTSAMTIPVSVIYEKSNIVYFAISATNNNVVRYGMRFIFRQIPNNDAFSKALVEFCIQQNYKTLVLLHGTDSYSEELSYAFRDYAVKHGVHVIYQKAFFPQREDFVEVTSEIKELKLDAIFIATLHPNTAAILVRDLRAMGVDAPIIGSETLDSERFIHEVGDKGKGIIVPTPYNPSSRHLENETFVRAFKSRYGHAPGTWAAQGYDAIHLLAHAMTKEVSSSMPANIANGLRYMAPIAGATGKYVYQKSGELFEKEIYFKELQNKEFVLFRPPQAELEQLPPPEILDDKIIMRPEKPSETAQ